MISNRSLLKFFASLWCTGALIQSRCLVFQTSSSFSLLSRIKSRSSYHLQLVRVDQCRSHWMIRTCSTSPTKQLSAHSETSTRIKNQRSNKRRSNGGFASTSSVVTGFGGGAAPAAATDPCNCGYSSLPYHKCCGRLHQDPAVWKAASPSDVVRARYTAYARRQANFLMESTHPLHPDFPSFDYNSQHKNKKMAQWKKEIERNGYADQFILNKCIVQDEKVDGNEATVLFVAHFIHRVTGDRTSFIEVSTFERDAATGAWLYKHGVVTTPESGNGNNADPMDARDMSPKS